MLTFDNFANRKTTIKLINKKHELYVEYYKNFKVYNKFYIASLPSWHIKA